VASGADRKHGSGLWAPHRLTWWVGVLFAIGSLCFFVGPFPGFVNLVGSSADGVVFFVGSLFFTSAALLQLLGSERSTADWWASLIQLVGTVYFNVDTFRAMQQSFDTADVNRVVWRPEALGSICFLISGFIALHAVRDLRGTRDYRIAVVNFAGCVLFGISTIGGYVLPSTGDALNLLAANAGTALGALCFLIGALMLLPAVSPAASPSPPQTPRP
jgi:hypothetical protein